jgi:hypothetical protein
LWRAVFTLGAHRLLVGDSRCPGEPVALVFGYQLVVGHTPLVQGGMLVTELSFRAFAPRLLLGDPSPMLGVLGLPRADFGFLAVLGDGALAALAKLPLPLLDARLLFRPREGEDQPKQNDYDHRSYDDDCPHRHSDSSLVLNSV